MVGDLVLITCSQKPPQLWISMITCWLLWLQVWLITDTVHASTRWAIKRVAYVNVNEFQLDKVIPLHSMAL